MKYNIKKIAYKNLENKPVSKLFPEILNQVKDGFCPICGNRIGSFRDEISIKEYTISGMCQKCQDKIFK